MNDLYLLGAAIFFLEFSTALQRVGADFAAHTVGSCLLYLVAPRTSRTLKP